MKISYAITACDEHKELKKLLEYLLKEVRAQDEILVLLDFPKITQEMRDVMGEFKNTRINWRTSELNGDFASFKNTLKNSCSTSTDYIFQIDADEFPHENLLKALPAILEINNIDLILVPRVNLVNGLTQEYINKWGWSVDEGDRINYPDYQHRIIANKPKIQWKNKVHEVIIGYKTMATLPSDTMDYCLYHIKDIDKQVKQNAYYDTLIG